jgi:uncharacterized membrane protein
MLLKPHRLFLCIALIFGSLMLFINQPFYGPDEANHFTRIIALSEGHLFSPGFAPASYEHFMDAYFHPHTYNPLTITLPASDSTPVAIDRYNRANVYSPAPYLGALPAVWLTLHMGASPQLTFYIARLGIFLASTLLIYAAIRISPVLQWPLCFIALYPTTVFIRSSLNADPLTLSYAFLFIALISRKIFLHTPVKDKDILQLGCVSALLCLSKAAYLLLPMLFFLLPKGKFILHTQYVKALVAIVVLPALLDIGWLGLASHAHKALPHGPDLNTQVPAGVDAAAQLMFCVTHAFTFLQTIWHTWTAEPSRLVYQFLGGQTEADIIQPTGLILPSVILLFLLPLYKPDEPVTLLPRERIFSLCLYLACCLLIYLSLYVTWTPVAAAIVNGVQGRYFAPLFPLLLLATGHSFTRENYRSLTLFTAGFVLLLELDGLKALLVHEYPLHG